MPFANVTSVRLCNAIASDMYYNELAVNTIGRMCSQKNVPFAAAVRRAI